MRSAMISMSGVLALMVALVGCGSSDESQPPPEYPPVEQPEPVTTAEPAPEPATETPPVPEEPPPPPVQVVAAERTPIEGDAPQLRLLRPRQNQLVRRGPVQLRARIRNWELSEAPGKHVHIIVDNEPYIAVRDLRRPIDLNALVDENLDMELEPGTHVVRMFPSRSHHESVKEGTPFQMAVFHFEERTEDFEFDPEAPLLTYSRPKGCSPEGERVLLDFYVSNAELGEDAYRVRYTIDGEITGDITEWTPHYIENLQPGEHVVRLQLLDGDETPVEGMFNDTARSITVGDCGDGPIEEAAEDVSEAADEAVEETGQAIEEAADEVEQATDAANEED